MKIRITTLISITILTLGFTLITAFAGVDPNKFIDDDDPKVDEDNGYIVSWLILDKPIMTGVGSTQSVNEDYFADQGGEANLMPLPGDTVEINGEEFTWVRYNQEDLEETGELPKMGNDTGNNLDLKDWGGDGDVECKL